MEPNWQDQTDAATEIVEPETSWPKVIGIISLIYGILGVLCQTLTSVLAFAAEPLMKMAQMDVPMPTPMKVAAVGTMVVTWILGVIMIMGAVRLLLRARSGVSLLKGWAVARLVMLVIGVGVQILIMPASHQFNRTQREEQNRLMRESNQPELPIPTDDEMRVQALLVLGGFSALTAAYPLFLGFYLARRKITDEVSRWV